MLLTKLMPPPTWSGLVLRVYLHERLDAHRTERLTLLSAPGGFGKTTLLSTWLESRRLPAAWLTLDAGDNDPIRFWTAVVAAIRSVVNGAGEDVLAGLRAARPVPIRSLLTLLINDLTAASAPLVLILDDYQVIEEEEIHGAVAFLVDHLPAQVRLIVASRADPPLPLARWRTRGELGEIRSADLRFTEQETATYLNEVRGLGLTSSQVASLDQRTEGWIAGIYLVSLSAHQHDDIERLIAGVTGSHRYIVDYLIEDIAARQPAEVQDFLLRTSILSRLSEDLCSAVVGAAQSGAEQSRLNHLERANLFVVPLDERRQWYRYHQLFAEALRGQLERLMPHELPGLHVRAARWYQEQGLAEEAIPHLFAAGDAEQAASVVEEVARPTLMRGELATVSRWIEALPAELVRSRPQLGLCSAWALLAAGRLDLAESRVEDALSALPESSDTDTLIEITAARGIIAFMRGDLAQVQELLPKLVKQPPRDSYVRSLAMLSGGLASTMADDLEAAAGMFQEASQVAEHVGDITIASVAVCQLAELRAAQGRLREAAALYEHVQRITRGVDGRPLSMSGWADVGLGELLREWNDLDGAARHLVRGVELARRLGEMAVFDGYVALGRVRQAQGDAAAALDALGEADDLGRRSEAPTLAMATAEAHRARAWLAQGRVAEAVRWADETEGRGAAPTSGEPRALPTFIQEIRDLTLARVRIAQGRSGEGAALLDGLLGKAEAAGRVRSVIEALALQALAHAAQGDLAAATATLRRALVLAEPEGFVRVFADEGPPMAELLEVVLGERSRGLSRDQSQAGEQVSAGYLVTLLAALGRRELALPARRRAASSELVEPLSEREQQVLRLLATGQSNREIAAELVVAESTAKWHVQNIYGKLGVRTRTQALNRAREVGLLAAEPSF